MKGHWRLDSSNQKLLKKNEGTPQREKMLVRERGRKMYRAKFQTQEEIILNSNVISM